MCFKPAKKCFQLFKMVLVEQNSLLFSDRDGFMRNINNGHLMHLSGSYGMFSSSTTPPFYFLMEVCHGVSSKIHVYVLVYDNNHTKVNLYHLVSFLLL